MQCFRIEDKKRRFITKLLNDLKKLTTNNKKCVVHFFHPDFKRCDILNNHLQVIYLVFQKTHFFFKLNCSSTVRISYY